MDVAEKDRISVKSDSIDERIDGQEDENVNPDNGHVDKSDLKQLGDRLAEQNSNLATSITARHEEMMADALSTMGEQMADAIKSANDHTDTTLSKFVDQTKTSMEEMVNSNKFLSEKMQTLTSLENSC